MEKKEKSPLVSVIIPTYNRGWIIQEAIDSVLAQDFADFELIVVDDGSTDNTLDIIRSYSEDIIFLRQHNKGVSAARNRGITSSAGHLIAFLDSDDLWFPEKLTIQVDFFYSHPDAFICQSEEIWIRNGVKVNPKKRHKKPSGMIFEPSLALCLVSPSAVMIKRSLFEEVGSFDECLPACEDYDLWLRVSCRYPIALIATPLVIKRGGHQDQLSRAPGLDKFRIRAIKKLLDSNLLSTEQQGHAVKALKEKCAIYASGCLKRSRLYEAEYYTNLSKVYVRSEILG
jgi:glycosyltransferase involved in cell wall biosynthesis